MLFNHSSTFQRVELLPGSLDDLPTLVEVWDADVRSPASETGARAVDGAGPVYASIVGVMFNKIHY